MGVRNWDFVPWKTESINAVRPQVLAIDSPNYLIRLVRTFSSESKNRNADRVPLSYLWPVIGILRNTLRANLVPVFIFDGPPEALKRPTNPELVSEAYDLYQRFKERKDVHDNRIISTLADRDALQWYFAVNHIKELLIALGVPAFTAPSEAEMAAAILARDGIAGTVVSNDVDALLFGAPHLTRSMKLSKAEIESVHLGDVVSALHVDLDQLKDLAILCGCDFYPGIKGIGPMKGISLLNQYGTLSSVLKAKGLSLKEQERALLAREVFDEPNYLHFDGIRTTLNPPLPSKARDILRPVYGPERSNQIINEFIDIWKEAGRVQMTLEDWAS